MDSNGGGLARSLIFKVWLCSSIIFIIGAVYVFYSIRSNSYQRTVYGLQALVASGARQIDAELEIIESRGYGLARVFSVLRPSEDKLKEYMVELVDDTPQALGVACGFAPNVMYKQRKFFNFYVWWEGGKLQEKEISDGSWDYRQREWYRQTKKSGQGYWMSPYRGKENDLYMVSFGAPFYLEDEFAGAVVVDLDLQVLKRMTSAIKFDIASKVFIVDRKSGRFIYYPKWEKVIKGAKLEDLVSDKSQRTLLSKKVFAGESGVVNMNSFDTSDSSVICFAPLNKGDWVIGVVYPERMIFGKIDDMILYSAVLAVLALGVLGFILKKVTGRIVAPLEDLQEAAAGIAAGNLIVTIPQIKEQNEIRGLADSIRTMSGGLASLVSQVKSAIVRQVSASTQIAAAINSQDESIAGFEREVSQAAAAVAEISASAKELAGTMEMVHMNAEAAGESAGGGHDKLRELEKTMRSLNNAAHSMAGKLELVRQSTQDVAGVVRTIADVAEQTNLLSLNASVEAEKAGEYGRGFSVVAREIRRLSDKTAVATLEITRMVDTMRSSVESGVAELEIFTETVDECAGSANDVAGSLGGIIRHVEGLGPKFEQVNHGMQAQSLGAVEISEAMSRLRQRAVASAESMAQLAEATEQLREAAGMLKSEVSAFITE